jgi:hypothetical protein
MDRMLWPFRRRPMRINAVLLNTLDALVHADRSRDCQDLAALAEEQIYAVYRVTERLRDTGWLTYEWETAEQAAGRGRRRLYRLTEDGRAQAVKLLTRRGPLQRLTLPRFLGASATT